MITMTNVNQPEIHDVSSAAVRAQQTIIDRILDVLETGDAINGRLAISYRDDTQAERMRQLRDKLHPDSEWAKRRSSGEKSIYDSATT